MNLSELYYSVERPETDKGVYHDYINAYYTKEFSPETRDDKINLLEIGIYFGGSIKLWLEWFRNAEITGIEYDHNCVLRWYQTRGELGTRASIVEGDAYSLDIVNKFSDNHFDYIIDDGPHTLTSQIAAVDLWVPKLKLGGKLIIEDVQNISWFEPLAAACNRNNVTFNITDTRHHKGTPDDIIFEVTKQ
jgi:cephalosporin hydroxylase